LVPGAASSLASCPGSAERVLPEPTSPELHRQVVELLHSGDRDVTVHENSGLAVGTGEEKPAAKVLSPGAGDTAEDANADARTGPGRVENRSPCSCHIY